MNTSYTNISATRAYQLCGDVGDIFRIIALMDIPHGKDTRAGLMPIRSYPTCVFELPPLESYKQGNGGVSRGFALWHISEIILAFKDVNCEVCAMDNDGVITGFPVKIFDDDSVALPKALVFAHRDFDYAIRPVYSLSDKERAAYQNAFYPTSNQKAKGWLKNLKRVLGKEAAAPFIKLVDDHRTGKKEEYLGVDKKLFSAIAVKLFMESCGDADDEGEDE